MPEGSQTYKEPIYHVSHASVSSVTSEDVTYQASTSWHIEMYLLNKNRVPVYWSNKARVSIFGSDQSLHQGKCIKRFIRFLGE